jgi:uncharacterized protein YjbI with pentapeptide repeats
MTDSIYRGYVVEQKTLPVDDEVKELIKRLKSGEKIKREELTALKNRDFSAFDLSAINLGNLDLSGCTFFNANLSETNFYQTNLTNADFTAANLTESIFTDATLTNVGFGHATLKETVFFNAKMHNSTLTGANIEKCDFRTADLSNSRMREAKIADSDFTRAKITDVDLSYTNVKHSIFNDADLRSTTLRNMTNYESCSWIGVDIRNVNFSSAYRIRRFIVDQNYIDEFKTTNKLYEFIYFIWWITSDCGRSMMRWLILILIQILFFAFVYSFVELKFSVDENWFSYIYFSIVTTTTLGYGDIIPVTPMAQIIASIQVAMGYTMLGGFLSILTNKLARRAD